MFIKKTSWKQSHITLSNNSNLQLRGHSLDSFTSSSAIANGLKAHDLMIIYMVFVHINDTSLDEDSIHHILNDVIPKSKFNDINTIIFNATNATGYPVTLNKEKLNESISDNGTTEWDDSMDSYESLDLFM